jgi:hypothetical protein
LDHYLFQKLFNSIFLYYDQNGNGHLCLNELKSFLYDVFLLSNDDSDDNVHKEKFDKYLNDFLKNYDDDHDLVFQKSDIKKYVRMFLINSDDDVFDDDVVNVIPYLVETPIGHKNVNYN